MKDTYKATCKNICIFICSIICTLILASAVSAAYTPISYYELDDRFDNELANDLTEHGTPDYLTGEDSCIVGHCVSLQAGSSEYLDNGGFTDPSTIKVVSFWVNHTQTPQHGFPVFRFDDGALQDGLKIVTVNSANGKAYRAALYTTGGVERFTFESGDASASMEANWTMLTITMNATKSCFFINGTLVACNANTQPPDGDCGDFKIATDYTNYQSMVIDNFYIGTDDWDFADVAAVYKLSRGLNFTAPAGPTPSGETIDVNITFPADNSAINFLNFTNRNLFINATHNDIGAVCGINTTDFALNDTLGNDAFFVNTTVIADGNYSIVVYCNRTVGDELRNGSASVYFKIDTSSPTISVSAELGGNLTLLVNNDSLVVTINISDNILLYSANLTWQDGTSFIDLIDIGGTSYSINTSNTTGSNTYFDIEVCDAHTSTKIDQFGRIDIDEGLKFVYKDNPLWLKDEYIYVIPKYQGEYKKAETKLKEDRYTFSFHKNDNTLGTETFVVYSTQPLSIVSNSPYGGHLVTNGYWIDFVNDEVTAYDLIRVDDYTVEVTVYGLTGKNFKFESVGGLNCITERYYFGNVNPVEVYDSSALSGDNTTFTLNVHYDANYMTNMNATLYYNFTRYNFTNSTGNFSVTFETPTPIPGDTILIPWNWTLHIDNIDYELNNHNQTVFNFFIDNCTDYFMESMNFSVRNITTDSPVAVDLEVFVDYSMLGINKTYSFSKNDDNFSLCIFPDWTSLIGDLHIDYTTLEGTQFNYIRNGTTFDNDTEYVILYTSDDTTLVSLNVQDTSDQPVVSAQIDVLEWQPGNNSFRRNSLLSTDYNGQSLANLKLEDTWYKFIITVQGKVVLNTEPAKIIATTLYFTINLEGDPLASGILSENLWVSLSFDNTTKKFTYTWKDFGEEVEVTCLKVDKITMSETTQINFSCSTDAAGAIVLGIGENISSTASYKAIGYYNNFIIPLIFLTVDFNYDFKSWEMDGIFASVLVIITAIFAGIWSPTAAIVMMTIGFFAMRMMGLLKMPLPIYATFVAVSIFIIIRINRGDK